MFCLSKKFLHVFVLGLSSLIWLGCGDGDGVGPDPDPTVYTIGGTVTGLTDSIVIRLLVDGEVYDELVLAEDGSFAFEEKVVDEAEYEVVPHNTAQFPLLDGCALFHIDNFSGTANGNVTTVAITCN